MKNRRNTIGKLSMFFVALTIAFLQQALAQVPTGYYDSAIGKNGSELKTALYNIIKDHTVLSYTPGLWEAYYTTDIDKYYENDGSVLDMYSENPAGVDPYNFVIGVDQDNGSSVAEGVLYNREHSFPKSYFNDASPMYTDIFHIYPTDKVVNSQRSNWPYGEVNSPTWTSANGSKLGPCSYTGYSGTAFEPIDEFKGDLARTYFYMATRYENLIASWESNSAESNIILDGTAFPCFETWFLNMLIEWHNNDPVSQKEVDRNNEVYTNYQHNRNPFIDHPEYVAKIWGGEVVNNPPSITNILINPSNPTSTDAVNVLATITDSDGAITNAVLRWGIVSGSLTNNINMVVTSGSVYSTSSSIPAQLDGVTVFYKIEATDDSSDVSYTNELNYLVDNNLYDIDILNEQFTTCPPTGWSTYSVASNKNWTCGSGYELINGYGGDVASNDWLIAPAINLDNYHNEALSFKSWAKYTDTGNHPAVKIKYSTDYAGSGSPDLATWTELNATWPAENSQTWTNSGIIDVSVINGANVYFAFQYTSTGTGTNTSSQWEIDSVILVGDDISTNNQPSISNITNSPENPVTGQEISISATITDSDGEISTAKLKWGTSSGNYSNTINLTASSNSFSGIIPSQSAGTTIFYIIEAVDNDFISTHSDQQQVYISEIPNELPEISGISINPTAPVEGQSVIVTATIIDHDGGISSALLKYGTNQGSYTQQVSMTNVSNEYSATIPSQTAGTMIYFIVEAIDNDDDMTSSPEQSFNVNAIGNEKPVISSVQFTPSIPTSNQLVSVSARITDSDGTISDAKIKWGTMSGSYTNNLSTSNSGDNYSGDIPEQDNNTHVYFVIEATDNQGGITLSSEYDYVVTDPVNSLPVISDISFSPISPNSSQTVIVSATIIDSDGTISNVSLKWGSTSGSYTNNVSMNNSGDGYSGNILAQVNTTHVYFVIEAIDNQGGITLSSEYNYVVTDLVNSLPVISGISFTPTVPLSTQSVNVSATISDTDGTIASANIKWGKTSGNYQNIITMEMASGNLYSGVIPAQTNGTRVYFVIEATDNNLGKQTSSETNYQVTDPVNQAPVISNVQYSPTSPTNLDSVLVSANISDADGTVSSAVLKWKIGAETAIFEKAMVLQESLYKAYIPAYEAGKTIYFIIVATDNNAATTQYMDVWYTISSANNIEGLFNEQVEIFPNPVKDILSINLLQPISNSIIVVYNVLGLEVLKKEFPSQISSVDMNVSGLSDGTYLVVVKSANKANSKKIIIKKD